MKTIYTYLFSLTAILFISSCSDKYSEELTMNVPVYMDYATLRSAVKPAQTRDLVHPGKICFKDQYLLIVEYLEGVHVIDVSNPASPQNRVFIEIPGCVDIALKGNFLYADSYVDLVTIDLSDIDHPTEKSRLKDVFPYTVPVAENEKLPYAAVEQGKGIVVSWEAKREKHELERNNYPSYPIYMYADKNSNEFYSLASSGGGVDSGSSASFGKTGSMARFGLYDNYLYIANNYMLYLFEVKDTGAAPVKIGTQSVGNVETLFVYDNHLFFGTPSGMLVYDLKIPTVPQSVRNFWHVTSCDPVVIQDGYAYITLRSGTACNSSAINRLDVVKCSGDYTQFNLINSYPMAEPYGLGIDGNVLFICDGKAGLKVYDATDKANIGAHLLASFPGIQTYDVIPANGYLFMIGDDGFYLYDYSDIQHIHLLGQIPVAKQ